MALSLGSGHSGLADKGPHIFIEEILILIESIDSDTLFNLSDNESIENYQPQASELLTESDSRFDNDDENWTGKSSTMTTIKSMLGVEWSLQTDNFNSGSIYLSSFRLLFDKSMMNSIQKYTTYHGQLTNSKFTVTIKDIEKFIELLTF